MSGFPKDEAIIPANSRNVYDAALRAVGVRVVEVSTMAEFEAALGPRTALIYILAGPGADASPLNLKAIAPIAKAKGVPIVVDAAAEILTIPNVHLENGATLVAYSGGKCLRGPQTAGLLLGRKDLVRAAWVHSAPHHGFARALKVGKEDAIGMLMAVEMWVKRDHEAEWKRWNAWLDHIAQRVSTVAGVTTSVSQPNGLSNRTPSLRVLWDPQKNGLSSEAVVRALNDGEPRITLVPGARRRWRPGRADRRLDHAVHDGCRRGEDRRGPSARGPVEAGVGARMTAPTTPAAAAADISGQWNVRIQYAAAASHPHAPPARKKGTTSAGSIRASS